MIYEETNELVAALERAGITRTEEGVETGKGVPESLIDDLVWTAVFSSSAGIRGEARQLIHDLAWATGAVPSSIQGLYAAIGRGEVTEKFTVPAHNIRTLTYDVARALFRAASSRDAGAIIFEIARSEIGYTEQRPAEYAACVLAAAVREGWVGPVFIQGDHFQASAKKWFGDQRQTEIDDLKGLIEEAINAEFYNIDIDTSTLVQLEHEEVVDQQRENYEGSAMLTKFIRDHEPEDVVISVGGEIGEVGEHNTTVEEFRAYIDGYRNELGDEYMGVSKVSIQTGTSHGGVPLPDGTIADASIDFERISEISRIAREEYGIGGAVQHGASTLDEEVFDEFPNADTLEIHLATGFQNLIYDHERFPAELRQQIWNWAGENLSAERSEGQTDEQFFYKTRKKALGPFKRQIWEMPGDAKEAITQALEEKFGFLIDKLGVSDTRSLVDRYVPTVTREKPARRVISEEDDSMAFVNEGEGE